MTESIGFERVIFDFFQSAVYHGTGNEPRTIWNHHLFEFIALQNAFMAKGTLQGKLCLFPQTNVNI